MRGIYEEGNCFFLILFSGILFANPIVPHLNITEIKFNDTGWQMELYSDFMGSHTNLDSCQVFCADGSSHFQPGINYEIGTLLVVTQEDLITPLSIDPEGDNVELISFQAYSSNVNFGSLSSMTMAPTEQQSLRSVGLSINALDTYFVFARDNTPSIGSGDDGEGFRGTFYGYVYDAEMNPVENVAIEHTPDCISIPDIITDENGYFEVELYAFNYNCHLQLLSLASMDSIITIDPEEQNYYEFVFEDYVHSENIEISATASYFNLSNHPNPFNPRTEISFKIANFGENTKIEIYNSKGQLIRTIPANINEKEGTVVWNGINDNGKPVPSDVYLYKLVSGNKELAVNKMLLLK